MGGARAPAGSENVADSNFSCNLEVRSDTVRFDDQRG